MSSKCSNRKSEHSHFIFPWSYSWNCTTAMQEDAKRQGEKRQIIFYRMYSPGIKWQSSQLPSVSVLSVGHFGTSWGTFWNELGVKVYGILHFCYYSSFQRTISTATIVKAKVSLRMGRQKADLET